MFEIGTEIKLLILQEDEMNEILERLIRDHANFIEVLNALEQQADKFEENSGPQVELMSEITDYLRNYADLIHHQREDLIFDRVLEKTAETADKNSVIRDLVIEHEQAAELSIELTTEVEGAFEAEQMRPRDRLPQVIRRYIEFNRRHMETEENTAFPLADRVLTNADWQAIAKELPGETQPEFESLLKQQYRALHEYISTAHAG